MDDDPAGHEGAERMIQKLGINRCRLVNTVTPHGDKRSGPKDANDALRQGYDLSKVR